MDGETINVSEAEMSSNQNYVEEEVNLASSGNESQLHEATAKLELENSIGDEIDLNSGDDEPEKEFLNTNTKLELRSEPEDIFEDIPEPKEPKSEVASFPSFESTVMSPRFQVNYN